MWYANMKAELNYSCLWFLLPSWAWTCHVTSASQFPLVLCTCDNNGVLIQTLLHQSEIWNMRGGKTMVWAQEGFTRLKHTGHLGAGGVTWLSWAWEEGCSNGHGCARWEPPAARLDLLVVVCVASAQAVTAKKCKKWGTEETHKK